MPRLAAGRLAVLFLLSALTPAPAAETDHNAVALQAARAFYDGIQTHTLDNGLRVYLKPIAGAPIVTTKVAYKVGSADEDLDQTGLSHYLEHLMFKGTEKLVPGDIDRLTQRNGGHNNAYTSEDYTVYHFDFATDRWEVALEIEADRMRNLRIDEKHEFQQEKGAVISELEGGEDTPWDLETKALLPLLFGPRAPYGHPVIGQRDHVRRATAEIIKAHYDRWYHPNNAALVVCGGFDAERALVRIKQLFGSIPRGILPERKPVPATELSRPARYEFPSQFEAPRVLVGFNTVAGGHADGHVLEVIQGLLAGGKTGRLYRSLVEGAEVAAEVAASSNGGRYPGWFEVRAELVLGADRTKAEALLLKELKRLGEEPVSAAELNRVRRSLLTSAVFALEGVHDLADNIARGVTLHDLEYLKAYLPRLLAVTAEDVQRVAKKYLDPERRVVVWSNPRKPGGGGGAAGEGKKAGRSKPQRQARQAGGAAGGVSLQDAKRVELPNGLVLLLKEDHRLPLFVAETYTRNIQLREPPAQAGVAALTGRLLDGGTAKRSGTEIAEVIENVGGNLSFSASGGSLAVLAPNRRLGLELLFECLLGAQFPPDAFAREKAQLLSQLEDLDRQPRSKALMAYRATVYGDHPYGRPSVGRRATAANLKPADCAAFHARAFVPNQTLVAVVGDFDAATVAEEVRQLTSGWQKARGVAAAPPAVEKPERFTQKILTVPGSAELHLFAGHVGIRRSSPDYHALLVLDNVFGTGAGFTDRLSARLRDREGLAYSVGATIATSAAEEPGTFTFTISTAPQNFARVKALFLEELKRLRDTAPTAVEVEDAKKYLLGSVAFELTTSGRVAEQLLRVERFGLGLGYLEEFRKAVAAIGPEDVQRVARKYLDPDRLVLVAAGAVDEQGKKLPDGE